MPGTTCPKIPAPTVFWNASTCGCGLPSATSTKTKPETSSRPNISSAVSWNVAPAGSVTASFGGLCSGRPRLRSVTV